LVLTGDESWETAGLAWFEDLTQSDPTYMLPTIAIGAAYGLSELAFGGVRDATIKGGQQRTAVGAMLGSQLSVRLRSAMQMGMIMMAPMIVHFPAGLFVVWVSNSALVTVQMLILHRPDVHRALTGRDLPRFREIQDHNMYDLEGLEDPDMKAELSDIELNEKAKTTALTDKDGLEHTPGIIKH